MRDIRTDVLLKMENISKVYGNGVYANKNVNLQLFSGEILALVGENGAGKSTLMKILFGLEKPSGGSIIMNGKEVCFHSPQDAMALGIGMVHQHFQLVNSLSITENVILGYEPLKSGFINIDEAKKKVGEICRIFDLKEPLDTPVGRLPVGTRQKVEIVKALYRGAKILILDEPTAVLTPQETAELFLKLKNLRNDGYTVIFISHKLREVKEISDRINVMRKGEMVGQLHTDEVVEQEISALMVGKNYSNELKKKEAVRGGALLDVKHVVSIGENKKKVVNDISFTVRAGEIVGIAGVEGNGQNELIGMLTGMHPIDGGEIAICGQNIARLSVRKLRELGLAYIPSDRMTTGLATPMSIEDNIIAGKLEEKDLYKNKLLSKKRTTKLANKLIKEYLVKCSGADTPINMLSGGNMQKVVVAREFTQEAKLIIAEQPTRGIDVGAAKFIHEELVKLRDKGYGVLLVSADLEELYKLSDSIFVMYDGEISAYVEKPEMMDEKELGFYMLGVKKQSSEEIRRAYYDEK